MTDDNYPFEKHEYMQRFLKAMNKGLIDKGCVYCSTVRHDGWCRIYQGGFCNCDPEIEGYASGGAVYTIDKDGNLEWKELPEKGVPQ